MTATNVIVTGGRGFIGSNFVDYALAQHPDWQITVVDNGTYAAKHDRQALEHVGIRSIPADIGDIGRMGDILADAQFVFNFAAHTHVDRSLLDPWPFLQSNIYGVQSLIDAIRSNRSCRLVHISTDEVYGDCAQAEAPLDEASPLHPTNPYAATKAAAEHLLSAAVRSHNIDAVIVRACNNFGPWQYPEKIIPLFITNALLDLALPLYGDGGAVRDYIHVHDNCAAIDLIAHQGHAGEAYNVGAGQFQSGLEIATTILDQMPTSNSEIVYVEDRPGHDRKYWVSAEKLHALGWQPQQSFAAAINATIEWYKQNESWWRGIRGEPTFSDFYRRRYAATTAKRS